jgi:hypothetical protein
MPKMGPKFASPTVGVGEILEAMRGPTTATIYRLDQNTLLPVEPLIDIVPSVSPNRQSLDVMTSSTRVDSYRVTTNSMQRGLDTTAHVKKELVTLTIQGLISGAPLLRVASAINAAIGAAGDRIDPGVGKAQSFGATLPGFPAPRRDLMQLQMLQMLVDSRQIIMVVTPEGALPRAICTRLQRANGTDVGEGTEITIDFMEARIVSPKFVDAIIDLDEILGGKTSNANAGGQPATAVAAPPALAGGGFG